MKLVILAASAAVGSAMRFTLGSIFSNNAVLPRDVAAPIWGTANPGQQVFATLVNTKTNATWNSTATADTATGNWALSLPAQPGSFDVYSLSASTHPIPASCPLYAYYCPGTTVTLNNIVFGDQVLCYGQSNMQVNVNFAFNASYELAYANTIGWQVRLFQVAADTTAPDGPLDDFASVSIPWVGVSNTTLGEFSATCWFSAKSIIEGRPEAEREVPLGLVESSWGGTPIKAWTSPAVNDQCQALYPSGGPDCGLHHAPCNGSSLFNAMLAPYETQGLRPRYMIWFQGENDAGEYVPSGTDASSHFPFYACQLGAMISDMRTRLQVPDAHFTTVQLAPYTGGWTLGPFRDMQCAVTGGLANTSCAVIDDGGDVYSPIGTVHSRNKQLVGVRVAAGILASVYGTGQQAIGPTYADAALTRVGSSLYANVSFTPQSLGGGGLVYVAPHVSPWQNSSRCPTETGIVTAADCAWFDITGSDGNQYNATSVQLIADNTMLALRADNVPAGVQPVGTRFGYNAWPVVNYYNEEGFPIAPWNVTVA